MVVMAASGTEHHVAAILNAAWMVRHYARGGHHSPASPVRAQRAKAIHELGLTLRDALNASQDFEPLLIAVVDGLSQNDDPPF